MLQTIVGKRGRGKTTLAKTLLINNTWDQVFILDFLGEYNSFNSASCHVVHSGLKPFCHRVWDKSDVGKKTLVIFDEIDLYGKTDYRIQFLYRYGRHKDIDIIAVARRFYDLPLYCRSLTDVFHLFQITEQRDLMYLTQLVPKTTMQILINLRPFQYIDISL